VSEFYNPDDLVFIQSRAEIDLDLVDEYAEMMKDGVQFHPARAVGEGQTIYVYDGFHRGEAAKKAGKLLFVSVKPGTQNEARWLALAANLDHGKRRSNADKRKVVALALQHDQFGAKLSDRQIAQHCGVHHGMVGRIRAELESTGAMRQSDTRIGGDGREINTANIGGNQAITPKEEQAAAEPARPEPDQPEWLAPEYPDGYPSDQHREDHEEAAPVPEPAPPPPVPKPESAAPAAVPAAPPPPPPPPPPIPKPAAPPDWHLHLTFKHTGACLLTLAQAGQVEPAANISTHVEQVLDQAREALAKYVPYYTNGKEPA
jgi:hypothetical protein